MMKAAAITIVLAIALPTVMATVHTNCYNYFLKKDGCVFSAAAANQRCPAPQKVQSTPVKAFALQTRNHKRGEETTLARRYNSYKPSFSIASGPGICGNYDTNTQLGVCLWSGAEQNNPTLETTGWLNGLKSSNCGKRVYIQRKGQPNTVQYAPVIDGCGFNDVTPLPGCFDIAVTIKLFNLFNPTPEEQKTGLLSGGITWDFDNLHGTSPQQAPV